eukprot:GFYU01023418.1.p1 GENE.GFYU01023418.1~~GFYU01023418.1.p1  ORF type:complete len:336 (+),score=108.40 GFYU01023418.1:57-1064(+)
MDRLKNIDFWRKTPTDLTEGTITGGSVSIVALVSIFVLMFSELNSFLTTEIDSSLHVDNTKREDDLEVNVRIKMNKLPCDILSLDVADSMGTHQLDVGGQLWKQRLNKDGQSIEAPYQGTGHLHHHTPNDKDFMDRAKKAIQDKEGCRIHGSIIVKKVPGNFHVSCHAEAQIMQFLYRDVAEVNVEHVIEKLYFANELTMQRIASEGFDVSVTSPLDNYAPPVPGFAPNQEQTVTYEYYLSIIPTKYIYTNKPQAVNQFTSAHNTVVGRPQVPAVVFRYDIAPVTVTFSKKSKSFLHFVVQLCAIVGGVFTVAGMVDGVIHQANAIRKARMGKLT